jgi:hypothetical protein
MKFFEIINDRRLATEAIRRWITVAIFIVISLVTAYGIAHQQFLIFAVLAGVAVEAFVTAGLQQSAWILVVIGWYFTGTIHALPMPLQIRDVLVIMVTFSYFAQRVFGQTPPRPRGVLGTLVVLNGACIALTFLYHPVGLRALGSQTMGGRAYFTMFISLCAYWVIVNLPESYKSVTKIPLWLLASVAFVAMLSMVGVVFPSIAPYVWYFYSGVDVSVYLGSLNPTKGGPDIQRLFALAPFGVMLIQVLSAYYPPRKLLNPAGWQFYVSLLGFVAILASGFRNSLAFALACTALAGWFHRGWREVVVAGMIGTVLLGFLIFGQGRLYQLPLPAQRALGSLPGQWDESVERDITGSNSRWEWWRQIVSQGSIKNWWIGDGFGMSETDFTLIAGGQVGFEESAEISGALHNGPLTAIHYAGIVGLIGLYALMIAAAIQSTRCVRRCRGTPLFPVAVFLATQLIWIPIHYAFIFGAYDLQLNDTIFLVAVLSLVGRMSERPPPSAAPAAPERSFSRNSGGTLVSA